MKVNQIVSYNKVIDEEIEHPVEDEVSPSAGGITEELLRHPVGERTIEKVYDFSYSLSNTVHQQVYLFTYPIVYI